MRAHYIILPALIAATVVGSFLTGRVQGKREAYAAMKPQTKIVYKDTTIYKEKPVPVEHTVYKDRPVEVPVYIHTTDTVIRTIYLPREERIYREKEYMAVVSGVEPSLDYLEIYQKNATVSNTVERIVKQRPRWSLGVHGGYGVSLGEQVQFSPYIGVGLSYNIISFGYH